jgi:two-component system, cell cycle sensor histidine kinase and response regulator CckA
VVLLADGGGEALAAAAAYAGTIHLVVTDIVMPGLSCNSLLAALRQQRPGLRAIVMSGYTDAGPASLPPGQAFLQKPFSPASLAKKVREVLDGPA